MSDNSPLIGCESLQEIIDEPEVRVVDCRFSLLEPEAGLAQYLEGHLPNAVYADLDKDLAAPVTADSGRHPLPDPADFGRMLGRLGICNDTRVVVYDQASGALAARLWWLLRWAGHLDASILDGGYARWQELELPLTVGPHEVAPASFEVQPDFGRVLTTDEIVAAHSEGRTLHLVDAREAQRFLGEAEPIDPVAGHIPGAVNLPFAASLDDNGTWKHPDMLLQQWQETLGEACSGPWSVMCGSGVTACHHVVSAVLAGVSEPRVYVGSWSEWIRDRDRPVQRG